MKLIHVKKVCENCQRESRYEVEVYGEHNVFCRFCSLVLDLTEEIKVSKRNRRNRNRGKRNQRALKRFLGEKAEDRGILGGADVVHDQHFYFEAKELKKIPSGFMKFWLQATHHCPHGRIPCVQIHELNQRHENDFIFMRLGDFKREITEKKQCSE